MAKCFACKGFFKSQKEFFNHLKIHYISNYSYFTCIDCQNKSFSSLESFRRHMKNFHFKIENQQNDLNATAFIPQSIPNFFQQK